MKRFLSILLSTTIVFTLLPTTLMANDSASTTQVTILATSDLHGKLYPYEYSTDSAQEYGLAKAYTVIKQQRAIDPNLILLDNGDTIESNMIDLFNDDEVHPMVKSFNIMEYDAWTLGNHEFNFGLDVLNRAITNFDGDVISANVMKGSNYFVNPYTVVESNGVNVAVIGITPPYVPIWEATNPDHYKDLTFENPVIAVQNTIDYINENEKVDSIIGLIHMGSTGEGYDPMLTDNLTELLNEVTELDAVIGGHSHEISGSLDKPNVINGTPVVVPASNGSYVAKVVMDFEKDNNGVYKNVGTTTDLISVKGVEADKQLLDEMSYVDERSKDQAYTVIGYATDDFLPQDEVTGIATALVENTAVINLINEVQMFYGGANVSAAALFDTRSDIKKGDIMFKDAALIYKYSNTLQSHKITGKNLKEYMEWSANFYNTLNDGDVTISFNSDIPSYNYDMFMGIDYKIDITKEAGNRIVNPTYNGNPINDTDEFILAINNYRVGTLQGLGLLPKDGSSLVFDSTLTNTPEMQRLIVKYIEEEKNGIISPEVINNWELISTHKDYPEYDAVVYLINNGYLQLEKYNPSSINVLNPVTGTADYEYMLSKLNSDDKKLVETYITTHAKVSGDVYTYTYNLLTIDPRTEVATPVKPTEIVDVVEVVDSYVTHTVVYGDTLNKIAAKYNTTAQKIADDNNISNINYIEVSDVLIIK